MKSARRRRRKKDDEAKKNDDKKSDGKDDKKARQSEEAGRGQSRSRRHPGSFARARDSARAITATCAWWAIAFFISAARSRMKRPRMTKTATATAKAHLCSYSVEDRKETVLGDVNGYEITADGKKMLVKIKDDYAIIDLPKDKIETKDEKAGKDYKLKLKGLDMQLDRHAQWKQIYFEAWRQMRDFFYAPNMNGVDWKAMRDKYAALVPFVNHRNDLTYLVRRTDRRIEQRPRLRRRRRTAGDAADQARPARRGVLARSGDEGVSDRAHFAGRKLGQAHAFAAHRSGRERESRAITFSRSTARRSRRCRISTTRSSARRTSR